VSPDHLPRRRFDGRSVVVTGAASGIGQESAIRFAREGGLVTVADLNEDGAQQTVDAITGEGGTARASVTDVSDAGAVQAMVNGVRDAYGRLDVLHNNAYWASLDDRPVADTSEEEWARTIAVTLTGVFLTCKYAIPHMIAGGGGAIVNTASAVVYTPNPAFAAYTAAKGGVVALTRSIALDYGRYGVRSNAIAPALVNTPATAAVLNNPELMASLSSQFVLGRPSEPADIASAVLFLASDDAGIVTGQTMIADGGRLLT